MTMPNTNAKCLHLEGEQGGGGGDLGALLQGAPQQHKRQQHGGLLEERGPRQSGRRGLQPPFPDLTVAATHNRAALGQALSGFGRGQCRRAVQRPSAAHAKQWLTATQETLQAAQAPMPTREFMSGAPRRSALHPSTRISRPGPAPRHVDGVREGSKPDVLTYHRCSTVSTAAQRRFPRCTWSSCNAASRADKPILYAMQWGAMQLRAAAHRALQTATALRAPWWRPTA